MVSEFIEEKDGYLALSDDDQDIEKSALAVLEIGEHREGYLNSQVGKAVRIADLKYPPSQGYHHVWCFDQSCGHTAAAEDASKMNKGKQPKMRDTVWNGQPQTMTLRPKGVALVLATTETGRIILADHDDFKNEKCRVDTFLSSSGHTCVFIPKFHCESREYMRAYCHHPIGSLAFLWG